MAEHGFLTRPGSTTVVDGLRGKGGDLPDLLHVHPGETVAQAIHVLREYGVSQLPVFADDVHDDARLADVLGSIRETSLLDAALADASVLERPVGEVMQEPLPVVGAGDGLADASRLLSGGAPALVVVDGDRPVGVLTRSDLLGHLVGGS